MLPRRGKHPWTWRKTEIVRVPITPAPLEAGDLESHPQAATSYITALRRAGQISESLDRDLAPVKTLSDPSYGGSPPSPVSPGTALDHLGAAYAELERREEAIEAYQQAMPALRAPELSYCV